MEKKKVKMTVCHIIELIRQDVKESFDQVVIQLLEDSRWCNSLTLAPPVVSARSFWSSLELFLALSFAESPAQKTSGSAYLPPDIVQTSILPVNLKE